MSQDEMSKKWTKISNSFAPSWQIPQGSGAGPPAGDMCPPQVLADSQVDYVMSG
jgi:hypothetical protein